MSDSTGTSGTSGESPEPHEGAAREEASHEAAPARRRLRASDADRDAVLEVIAQAHANGRLDPEEVDERQSQALGTKILEDLPEVIDDLPEGQDLVRRIRAITDPEAPAGSRGASGPGGAPGAGNGWGSPRPGGVIERLPGGGPGGALAGPGGAGAPGAGGHGTGHEIAHMFSGDGNTSMAILSGKDYALEPGTSQASTVAILGGDNVDLTEVMGPGVEMTMNIVTLLGGDNLYVPPGVRIVDKSMNILGGHGVKKDARGDGSNGTLVLTGLNVLGGSEVKLHKKYKQK